MVAGVARRPRNGIILSAALSLIATSRTALMLQKGPFPAAAAAAAGVGVCSPWSRLGRGWLVLVSVHCPSGVDAMPLACHQSCRVCRVVRYCALLKLGVEITPHW